MLPDGSIEVEQLWKRFRADRRRSLFRDEFQRIVKRGRRGWTWALRDVSLSVEPGGSLGLIGVNGSGKSTLLKILTRVMYPHSGRLTIAGRVAAQIEVSSGIHSELTGRENIFFYGSLLGLKRRRVIELFDEIVEFAELEAAIDRQAKFYSSGMKMRLGFAVASFLEPDVLLVDEVLAVGDASFQQRCLDRMRYVLNQGTTLVFVSHDLAAVAATCNEALWLHAGATKSVGRVEEVLAAYRHAVEQDSESLAAGSGDVRVLKVSVSGTDSQPLRTMEDVRIDISLEVPAMIAGSLHLGVSEGLATPIFTLRRDVQLSPGIAEVSCSISDIPLPAGRYYLWVGMFSTAKRRGDLLGWHPVADFELVGPRLDPPPRAVVRLAPVYVKGTWDVSED